MITYYYEVEFAVPGDRLDPPRDTPEWWKALGSSIGMESSRFNYADAQRERARYRNKYGYKTRLRQIKIKTFLVEEDD